MKDVWRPRHWEPGKKALHHPQKALVSHHSPRMGKSIDVVASRPKNFVPGTRKLVVFPDPVSIEVEESP